MARNKTTVAEKRKIATESTPIRKTKAEKKGPKFRFIPRQWQERDRLMGHISLQQLKMSPKVLVVKKTVYITPNNDGTFSHPMEVNAMKALKKHIRIVTHLDYLHRGNSTPIEANIIFPYFPLGDVFDWRKSICENRNFKPVPESFIWRMFVQMTQAIAFLQCHPDDEGSGRQVILHRDIKPGNVLVVHNGTTYPSFKLHDFGCARSHTIAREQHESYCGTYEWQPPENPMINTTAAEIYALGGLVHFLATGRSPATRNNAAWYRQQIYQTQQLDPAALNNYSEHWRYYMARCPRVILRINVSVEVQEELDEEDRLFEQHNRYPYPVYSDELDGWMVECTKEDPAARCSIATLMEGMITDARAMLWLMAGKDGCIDL